MEEMLQLFAQPGVFDRQAEGVNNHQSDHSGHPHLDEVAGDGSDGDDEVAIDDGLGEVVPPFITPDSTLPINPSISITEKVEIKKNFMKITGQNSPFMSLLSEYSKKKHRAKNSLL